MTKSATKSATETSAKTAETTTKTQVKSLFTNVFEAGKLALSNTIELDKAILGYVRTAAKETVEHGRTVMGAKDIKTAMELQTAFLTNTAEQGISNTKEIAELAQLKTKEVVSAFNKAA